MKANYFKIPLFAASVLTLAACSQQDYPTGAAVVERSVVEMVRFSHPVKAEDDSEPMLSDETVRNLTHFISVNNIGYGDVVLFDLGESVSADRLTMLKQWFVKKGVSLGETGIFGAEPLSGSIKVYVEKTIITPPDCQRWSNDSLNNPNNAPATPLGCVSQSSLATMVANPRDLVTGARSTRDPNSAVQAVRSHRDGNKRTGAANQ